MWTYSDIGHDPKPKRVGGILFCADHLLFDVVDDESIQGDEMRILLLIIAGISLLVGHIQAFHENWAEGTFDIAMAIFLVLLAKE